MTLSHRQSDQAEDRDRRKRALFVINSLAGGGAERVMTTLLRASENRRDRFDITLALLDREPIAYSIPDWVETVQFDCRGRLLPAIAALRGLAGRLRPDVSLSFLTRANFANAAAMAGRGPFVLSERVNTSAHLNAGAGAGIGKALVRLVYPRARRVIAVSQGVADDLADNFAVSPARINVVANPVDHVRIAALAAEAPAIPIGPDDIVAAGRLVPNKNFAMLIDAFARSGLPGKLVILGEGPLRAELEAEIARHGLEERVLLPGFVENPFAILKRAGLFALPSNAEGFPNGLVEAMACGLPVVATNCASGPSEILLDRRREEVAGLTYCTAGAIVLPNDADGFANALREVGNPAQRAARGDAALGLSKRFSVERTAARYWEIIENALEPGDAPARSAMAALEPVS